MGKGGQGGKRQTGVAFVRRRQRLAVRKIDCGQGRGRERGLYSQVGRQAAGNKTRIRCHHKFFEDGAPWRYRTLKSRKRRRCSVTTIAEKIAIPEDLSGPHRPLQSQGVARIRRQPGQKERRQADPGDRDQPDARRRGQDHHHRRPGRCAEQDRQEGGDLPARAEPGAGVRHEGRRRRRRLRAGRADGRHQPALHRRLQRDRAGQQPARRR